MAKPKFESRVDIPSDIMYELLTPSEVRMIKNRWRIIGLIKLGWPIRQIAQTAKVGTDTVVRMSKKLNRSQRIKQFLNRNRRDIPESNASKWVFGQIKDR